MSWLWGKKVFGLLRVTAAAMAACLLAAGFLAFAGPEPAYAEAGQEAGTARELTALCRIEYGETSATVSCDEKIAGIYLEWKNVPGAWTLEAGGRTVPCGTEGFLHEYIAVGAENTAVLRVGSLQGKVNTVRVFGAGTLPAEVQVWEPPCEEADLMLFSTHADDEHLFFAGILPYYAGELRKKVQVVYMVNHNDSESRPHELLNGLWAVGVRHYPVISAAPDLYSESLAEACRSFADEGYEQDYFIRYVTEAIRRFRPLVAVGHDLNGEYGHGAHMLYADVLKEAWKRSGDADYDPESAEQYGVWTVPKLYLHLYEENPIVIDWDGKLLSAFGGRSAFQVSVEEGYARHESQHYTWFSKWCGYDPAWNVRSAADIETLAGKPDVSGLVKEGGFSPRRFGLYASTVGEDREKNDFFENISVSALRPQEEPDETPSEAPGEETLVPDATPAPSGGGTEATEASPGGETAGAGETSGSETPQPQENREPEGPRSGKVGKVIYFLILAAVVVCFCVLVLRYLRRR